MAKQYIFDKDLRIRRVRMSKKAYIRKFFWYFLGSISLAVLYYIVFALIFSTDTERQLKHSNKMYEMEFAEMERKSEMIEDVIEGLQVRDNNIYEEIFHTASPNMDSESNVGYVADTIPDEDMVLASARKLEHLQSTASKVEENFREIMNIISSSEFEMPPMTYPLKEFSFAQTAASIGEKINPFYKVPLMHNGLDLIASSGDPVYAAADGVVREVRRSRKGLGNVVMIDHGNGYKTRYAHLDDINVYKGRKVTKGQKIGTVGVSGNSFVPHLHYEVLRDTLVMDPVNHFFATVSPEEYVNMLIMSVSTKQSMD